jgi:hypothetical protein
MHRTGQVPNYWIFQIMRWYAYWPKFLQVMFCCWSYTFSVQLMRGVFIWWFRVIRVLFCVFYSGRQGASRYHNSGVQTLLEVLNMSLRSNCFVDSFFLVKSKTSGLGTIFLRCWIISCQIKGILLYWDLLIKDKIFKFQGWNVKV